MAERSETYSVGDNSVNFHSDKERMVTGGSSGSSPRALLVALVVVAIIAVVALVVAAMSFTRQPKMDINVTNSDAGRQTEPTSQQAPSDTERIWTFAIGHDGTSLEYIHDDGGLRGFHVDVVNAVCEMANKDCRLIFDVYQRCWESQSGHWPRAGQGLMDRWYDACTGWFATYERLRTVAFTDPFRETFKAAFYVKSGNPRNFDWTNIYNKTIAIFDGWASDEYCIKRNSDKIQNAELSGEQMVHLFSKESILDAVNNEEVDAAFINVNMFTQNEVEKVSDEFDNCMKAGGSMMMRKDNTLASWWNPAFARLKETGQYRRICESVADNHGHMPGSVVCLD
ncbi:arginine-binding periplasmic protein-like isoform X1 [Ptychodera flava]|uniref:arginine-binding periplasmic protein-like isoform X1 n=2 Tax=Ptychodera flava TaxID=63121 RepID=UPI003969D4EB